MIRLRATRHLCWTWRVPAKAAGVMRLAAIETGGRPVTWGRCLHEKAIAGRYSAPKRPRNSLDAFGAPGREHVVDGVTSARRDAIAPGRRCGPHSAAVLRVEIRLGAHSLNEAAEGHAIRVDDDTGRRATMRPVSLVSPIAPTRSVQDTPGYPRRPISGSYSRMLVVDQHVDGPDRARFLHRLRFAWSKITGTDRRTPAARLSSPASRSAA